MVAMARALMLRPSLMLLDEPSHGLAPLMIAALYDKIQAVHQSGVAMLIVEQNARLLLSLASRVYVVSQGRIALEGSSKDLMADERVQSIYLGGAG